MCSIAAGKAAKQYILVSVSLSNCPIFRIVFTRFYTSSVQTWNFFSRITIFWFKYFVYDIQMTFIDKLILLFIFVATEFNSA